MTCSAQCNSHLTSEAEDILILCRTKKTWVMKVTETLNRRDMAHTKWWKGQAEKTEKNTSLFLLEPKPLSV